MKHLVSFALLLVLFQTCTEKEPNYVLKLKLKKLDRQSLFNADLAKDFVFDAEELNIDSLKTKSRQLFLQGVDLYKNKKAPEKAIEKFIASILTFPEAKTYYELGNAWMEVGDAESLENAIKSYKVTRELGFQPRSTVLYNEGCAQYQLYTNPFVATEMASNQKGQKERYLEEAIQCLSDAFREGFYDTLQLKNDPRLKGIAYSPEFKTMLVYHTAKRLKNDASGLFALYREAFPEAGTTFAIGLDELGKGASESSISYDFAPYIPEMENVSFGRDVSNDFFYVAKVAENPTYTAVIYKAVSFYGENYQPSTSTLVTYDPKGEVISKVLFSCECSASKVKTGKIESGTITIEEYTQKWRDPLDKVPRYENKVTGHDFVAKAQYKIDDSGKILEESVPQGFSDSTNSASSTTKTSQF